MHRSQLFTGLVAMSLITAGCNRAETQREAREAAADVKEAAARAGDRLADGWVAAKVQAKFFADRDVKSRYIDVSSRDGVVTLQGFVENDRIRQEALQIARNTDGVRQIDDQLLIGQAPRDVIADGAVATSGSTLPAPGAGEAHTMTDDMVTSLIQAKYYRDPQVKVRNIEVMAASGVVTLRGEVASEDERSKALTLARTTAGVDRVEDALSVDASLGLAATPLAGSSVPGATQMAPGSTAAPASAGAANAGAPRNTGAPGAVAPDTPVPGISAPNAGAPGAAGAAKASPPPAAGAGAVGASGGRPEDASLEAALRTKLMNDAALKAAGIEVSARNGIVQLQGTVPTAAAKQRAVTVARETEGVTQVVDRLNVSARR